MDRDVYQRMEELEARHWWFVARRRIISEIISRMVRPAGDARILEAGCGSGGNLALLQKFGTVDAFEYDDPARSKAQALSGLNVAYGALPDELPFELRTYDIIGIFDVLEHVEPDVASLKALRSRLKPGGAIVVTVPAFPWLWSHHDEAHHHFRRYTRSSLSAVANQAGLNVERSFYFNTLLFPLAMLVRILKRLTGSNAPDDAMPSAPVNAVLAKIFASERHVLGRFPTPVGLSLGAVLRSKE